MADRIRVTCAIIERDGMILAAQRSENMSLPLKWEFPGGKVEPGETASDCMVREIKEELGWEIDILEELPTYIHIHGEKVLELIPFRCRIGGGELRILEHNQIAWEAPRALQSYDLAEADVGVLEAYLASLN